MEHCSKYIAKKPDKNGLIKYSDVENSTWGTLYDRQTKIIQNRACDAFINGLDRLQMSSHWIPQCTEINRSLLAVTGWSVEPVAALIPVDYFFSLLSQRKFPAATFIRIPEELDYLQEPDIFHEFFGHCPLLTDPIYADFMQKFGVCALKANHIQREYFARLYWFTVEFGIINTASGYRNYGGGILSSKEETVYAVESQKPKRYPLGDGIQLLRTPYRIDIIQPIYFAIDGFETLYQLLDDEQGLLAKIDEARQLGDFEPTFALTDKDKMILRC